MRTHPLCKVGMGRWHCRLMTYFLLSYPSFIPLKSLNKARIKRDTKKLNTTMQVENFRWRNCVSARFYRGLRWAHTGLHELLEHECSHLNVKYHSISMRGIRWPAKNGNAVGTPLTPRPFNYPRLRFSTLDSAKPFGKLEISSQKRLGNGWTARRIWQHGSAGSALRMCVCLIKYFKRIIGVVCAGMAKRGKTQGPTWDPG